ncbi:MAG: ABC transporter permease subunit [Deltaproteobacteria bacterium]|nr:ABC transporter permease subunit [Deltaproteobacteria bacterium]
MRVKTDNIYLGTVVAFVAALSLLPPLFLLWSSLKPVSLDTVSDWRLDNLTLDNFRDTLADPASLSMIFDSLFFAFGSMLVAFIFGGIIAFLVERTDCPFRDQTYGFMFVPLILPSMLKAIGWVFVLEPNNGILNNITSWLGLGSPFNAYTIVSMFWVQGLSMSPLTFLMLGASLRSMDPSLEEASTVCGAGKFQTARWITLRLMIPALAGIGLLQFIRGMEAFEVPLIMGLSSGVQVFATNIYFAAREVQPPAYGHAFALSVVLILIGVFGLLVYQKLMSDAEQYATITGKAFRPRIIPLGKWRPAAGGFILFYLFVAMGIPVLVLMWISLLPYYQLPSMRALSNLTMANYYRVLGDPAFILSLKNTAVVGVSVSVGCVLLATIISWLTIRRKGRGGKVLDAVAFIPYAIPGIAMGLSFLVVFLAFPNPIYGTLWILILIYLVSFLPIATRFSNAGLRQLHKELEEAATVSGSGFLSVLKRIVIPLIFPSLLAGGLYVFVLSAKVASQAAVLWSPDSIVLSIYMLMLWIQGNVPAVAALCVIMTLAFVALAIVSRSLARRFMVGVDK